MRAASPLLLGLLLVVSAAPAALADHPGTGAGLSIFPSVAAGLVAPEQLVHNARTLEMTLAELDAKHPGFVERMTIGKTSSGMDLLGVVVTDEAVAFDAAPLSTGHKLRVYLDGGHHGNEYLGVELVVYYLEDLLAKAEAGDEATLRLLRETEIHAVPMINVDGNTLDTRKNSRLVDPNRNYDFHWGEEGASGSIADFTYRGPSAFSESETKANADYQAAISPDMVVTMHTGIAEFYWPWGWTHDPSPDDALFTSLEKPFEDATNGRVDAMQGAELYIVSGASDDWAYGVLGTPGFTFEVHEDQFVPVYGEPISDIIADQLAGLEFMVRNVQRIGAWIEVVPDGSGGYAAENQGWGVATNATFTGAGGSFTLERLEPGERAALPFQPEASKYAILQIDVSRVREHSYTFVQATGAEADAQVPGPGLGLLVVAALAGIALRRRAL